MKRLHIWFLCFLMVISLVLPVSAAVPNRVVDMAGLLTQDEVSELTDALDGIWDTWGMDVVIVTVDALQGANVTAYADDYYDYNGYSNDGILLLVSMAERQWAVSTAGYGIYVFTDAGIDYMADQFLPDLSVGNYAVAFETFAELCEEFLYQAYTDSPYDVADFSGNSFRLGKRLLICFGLGLVVALVAVGVMYSQLKNVHSHTASHYVRGAGLKLTASRDLFLYANVSRRKRESSSSGGSSTHRSSSGRSHGGRSGGF